MIITISGVGIEGTAKEVADLLRELATKEVEPNLQLKNFEEGDLVRFKEGNCGEDGTFDYSDGFLVVDYASPSSLDPYSVRLTNGVGDGGGGEDDYDWARPEDLELV